jgi:hypothetical protein
MMDSNHPCDVLETPASAAGLIDLDAHTRFARVTFHFAGGRIAALPMCDMVTHLGNAPSQSMTTVLQTAPRL